MSRTTTLGLYFAILALCWSGVLALCFSNSTPSWVAILLDALLALTGLVLTTWDEIKKLFKMLASRIRK